MKAKKVVVVAIVCMFLSACAGMNRTPNPVDTKSLRDTKITCDEVKIELENTKKQIEYKQQQADSKFGTNMAIAAVGGFFLGPLALLACDFSGTENIEKEALVDRYNYLIALGNDKGCDMTGYDIYQEEKKKKEVEEADTEHHDIEVGGVYGDGEIYGNEQ